MADARDNERAGYGFTRKDHRRVSDVVRAAEGAPSGGNPSGGPGYPGRRGRPVIATDGRKIRYAQTPLAGIPAMNSSTLVMGSAMCAMFDSVSGTLTSASENATVYNSSTSGAVTGNRYIAVGWDGVGWTALTDPCA